MEVSADLKYIQLTSFTKDWRDSANWATPSYWLWEDRGSRGQPSFPGHLWCWYDKSSIKLCANITHDLGQSIAHQWYLAGCRTLDDVRTGKGGVKMSTVQEIGLRFYDGWSLPYMMTFSSHLFNADINDRMPRSEVKAIFDLIKPKGICLNNNGTVECTYRLCSSIYWPRTIHRGYGKLSKVISSGSYDYAILTRVPRGKADCGDIDILITRPTQDGKTHRREFTWLFKNVGILANYLPGVMPRLLRELHTAGILTEDLALPEDPDDLEASYRGLCHIPHIEGSRRRRIDILSVPWTSRGAALLYFTVCFWLMLVRNIHLNKPLPSGWWYCASLDKIVLFISLTLFTSSLIVPSAWRPMSWDIHLTRRDCSVMSSVTPVIVVIN